MIVEQAEALERLYGQPTYCHVVVRAPNQHRRNDGRYDVSIYLTMPGHIDICIDDPAPLDSRFTDPQFAVSEAFRRARGLIAARLRHEGEHVKSREQGD